jgi:hypothetical protein
MTKDEQVQYWLDIADYDLDTAEAMIDHGDRSLIFFTHNN